MPSGTRRGRRTLVLAAAWAGVTAVACAVVWLGVDSVLIPAAETPPAVLAAGAGAAGTNSGSATTMSKPPTVPVSPSPSPSKDASVPAQLPSPSVPAARSGPALGRYATGGGVVVLAIGAHSVSLVSATPAAGYSVQNWSADGWLRVDFDQGSTTYSVFATWNGYSPQVQVVSPNPGH